MQGLRHRLPGTADGHGLVERRVLASSEDAVDLLRQREHTDPIPILR
jgi:hypothetical protein